MNNVLGIDVGGSGIKGAPVDLEVGDFAEPRLRIPTPQKSSPKNVAAVIKEIIEHFSDSIGDSPVGVSFPAPSRHGVIRFIANLDQGWAGLNAEDYLSDKLGHAVTMVNDADAAGLGEVHYGAAKGVPGVVISPPWAPASAPPSSTTAFCCPTPRSATWRSTATTRRSAPPPR
jgi:polyphosphate glucokinase